MKVTADELYSSSSVEKKNQHGTPSSTENISYSQWMYLAISLRLPRLFHPIAKHEY